MTPPNKRNPQALQARIAGVVVLIAMTFGFYLRFLDVGGPSFNEDELFHVRAAQSINETGRPTLPGGHDYKRAIPFTQIIAVTFRFLGESETTARLPNVVFGTFLIWLTYVVGMRIADRSTGVLAAVFMAVAPFAVLLSRFTRMYAPHQCLYLLAFLMFFRAFENDDLRPSRRLMWMGAAGAVLAVSIEMHDIAAFFVAGLFSYCVWRSLQTTYLEGWRAGLHSRYGLSVIVMAIIGSAALALPSVRREILQAWTWLPEWAEGNVGNYFYYRWFLRNEYGLWSYLALYGALWLAAARPREGAYLVSHFIVPILVLSIWPLKSTRYMAHLFPLFIVLLASGFRALIGGAINIGFKAWRTRGGPVSEKVGYAISTPIFITAALVAVYFTPGAATPGHVRAHQLGTSAAANFFPWKDVGAYLKAHAEPGDVVIGSRTPMVLYYFGRVDFSLDRQGDVELRSYNYHTDDGRLLDNQGGVPYIENTEQFKEALSTRHAVWLALQKSLFKTDRNRLSPEERAIIENDFRRVFATPDGSLLIFHRSARS